MAKIKVGFSKPNKWKPFAWLIMAAYGIPYDHVYVRLHANKYNRDLIYQASKTMVNFMGTDMFLSENVIVNEFEIEIEDSKLVELMQFAIDNACKPYGLKQCVGLAWVRICELFGKKISNPFKPDGSTYVCSELAGYILDEFAGMNIDSDIANITPLEVYNYLIQVKAKQDISS